jgi:hypothetical protein
VRAAGAKAATLTNEARSARALNIFPDNFMLLAPTMMIAAAQLIVNLTVTHVFGLHNITDVLKIKIYLGISSFKYATKNIQNGCMYACIAPIPFVSSIL